MVHCGATEWMAAATPGVRLTRATPVPSARTPIAIGGRFGPQRTASSRDQSARTGRCCSLANVAAAATTGVATFPPKAPPFPSGSAPSSSGRAHDASVSRYAGSTHVVRSVSAQSPSGTSIGQPRLAVVRRPWRLPDAARASRTVTPVAHPSPAGRGAAHSASLGAESSANRPAPAATSEPTRWCVPPSIDARRAARSQSRGRSGTLAAAASKIVRQPVHRQRWASSARPTVASSWRSSALNRMMMPGVQKPH